MIAGIDISNHQQTADFHAMRAAGYQFCIHKASEGVGFVDRYLAPRWPQMAAANVARGCYHYALPSASSAEDEAAFFVGVVAELLAPGDSVWLDIEDPALPVGSYASHWCLEWLGMVEAALGVRPGLYTYPSYVTERNLTAPALAAYPLWWASYEEPMRPAPWPWSEVAIWQHSSSGSVPGLPGLVDVNWLLADDIGAFLDLGLAPPVVQWQGSVRGRAHWGGDPLPLERIGDALYRLSDGAALNGVVLDDWQTTTTAAGQLTRDDDAVATE